MPETVYRTVRCDDKEERQQVLVMQKHEWDHVRAHLVRRQKEAEHVEFLHDKKEAVKLKSEELKKTWTNTQMNIRDRMLEGRAERLAAKEAHRAERSLEMQQIRAEERKKFLNQCKRLISYTKDDFKLLNSALILSETLRERAAQLEFEKMLKEIQANNTRVYVENMKADVKAFEEEEAKKKQNWKKVMLEYKDALVDQRTKHEDKLKQEFNTERKLEVQDLQNIHDEIVLGERLERELLERQRAKVRENVREALESQERYRKEKQAEEEEEDKVIAIYAAAKERIEKRRRATEKEAQENMRLRREKIAASIGAAQDTRDAKENASLRKANAEKEAKDLKAQQDKDNKIKRQNEETIQDYKNFLDRDAKRKELEKNLLQWDMLQRFKADEVNREHAAKMQKLKEEKTIATREMCLTEIAANAARKAAEYDEEADANKAKWQHEDDEFLKYADEMVEDSKKKGRMLYPIQKVIVEYKMTNGLTKVNKDRRLHQSKLAMGTKNEQPASDLCICYDKKPQNIIY